MLQAAVVMDSGATKTGIGVEAMRALVDAVAQGFPESLVEVDSLDRPWFRFPVVTGARFFQESGC